MQKRWARRLIGSRSASVAGSKNAQVATLTENMARLGHKTVGAALRYQHSESGRDAIIAKALSAKAIEELESSAEG